MGSKKWFFRGEEKNFYELPNLYKKSSMTYLTPQARSQITHFGTTYPESCCPLPCFLILTS